MLDRGGVDQEVEQLQFNCKDFEEADTKFGQSALVSCKAFSLEVSNLRLSFIKTHSDGFVPSLVAPC